METQQDDNKDLEPKILPEDTLESAQKTQQDDIKDLEPEMQRDEIEKSAQETQLDEHNESGPNILEMLSLNCLRYIFSFLTINDLVRSERVCRTWREFVLQYLPFVQNYRIAYCNNSPCKVPDRSLSFRSITLSMRKGEINKMIHKMGKYFVRVYSDCIDEEDSKALAVHCPHLEYLLLSGTHIKLVFDDDELAEEESQKRKLTGIFLTDLRMNLKTVGLSFFKPFKVEYLQSAVHRLDGLTRLDLNSISVETLQSVSSLLEQMPLIEHLSLMEYERGRESGIDPPCFDRLSRLRELHLWGNEFVTDSWVEAAATCETLRVFNVGTCFEVRMRAVIALCQKRRELTELVVSKLRLTDADLEACVGYCRDLELLDASWCTRLTRSILTRLSRPNTRPLVLRLHGTRITESNTLYEGLNLRLDLPPELYNPLQVRYARGPRHEPYRGNQGMGAEYVVLEHAIAIDLPDIHPEDDIRAVVDVGGDGDIRAEDAMRAEGDIRAENAMDAEDPIRADNAIHADNDIRIADAMRAEDIHAEDALRAQDDIRAEDDVGAEEAMYAENGIRVEEVMHAGNNIRVEAIIHAEDVIRAEVEVRGQNDLREENAIQVEDNRLLPIERRAEDRMHADNDIRAVDDLGLVIAIPEEEIRENVIVFAMNRQIVPMVYNGYPEHVLRAMAIVQDELLEENGHMEDDAYQENDAGPENDADPENDAYAENDHDLDDVYAVNAEPPVNGFHPEDDIYPEDDIFLDNEMQLNERLVEIPVHPEDGMFAMDGVFPLEQAEFVIHQANGPAQNGNPDRAGHVLNQMYEDLVRANGAVGDRDLFADNLLFARDELLIEDDDDDDDDD